MLKREGRGPRTVDFTDAEHPRSGVTISFVKSRRIVSVSGWYDTFVGIEGADVPLEEFLGALGITAKDVVRAGSPEAPGEAT